MNTIFTENELGTPYKLQPVLLPTKNDVLRYVLSRIKSGRRHDPVVREMAEAVSKIWTDADCCPYSVIQIIQIFEKDVWDVYYNWLREKRLPDSESIPSSGKRSHKRNPSKPNKYSGQPRRKSSRRDVASA